MPREAYEDDDEGYLLDAEPTLSPEQLIEKRILTALKIYPKLSPSMLQSSVGPHNPARFWKPILEQMIHEGRILRHQESHLSELNRWRTVTILELSPSERARLTQTADSALISDNPDHYTMSNYNNSLQLED